MNRPASYFDKDLRDHPQSHSEWKTYVADLQVRFSRENAPLLQLEILEYWGMALRTLGRLDEAEETLVKALGLAKSIAPHSRVVQNMARLAHVYQWQGEFQKAYELYRQIKVIVKEKPISKGLTAALHQHLGKVFFDEGYLGAAQAEFAVALKMRELLRVPEDQIESSRSSLAEARRRRSTKSDVYIRRAFYADAEGIHKAHMKSIQQVCAKDHTPQEIQGWGHRPFQKEQRLRAIENDWVWAIEDQNEIEGYGYIAVFDKEGHREAYVYGLYLTPKMLGRGVGKNLFETVLEVLKSQHVGFVRLDSTITAQEFYKKMGFVNTGPEKTVEIGGSPVRCYPMKLTLGE
jgi:GNAT superfamily N-acetyltransferase